MSSVLLTGYYGMKNVGDDALLAVASWGSRHFLKADRIYATAAEIPSFKGAESIRSLFASKESIRGENRLRAYCNALCAQHVIFGGGSVFHSSRAMNDEIRKLKLSGKGHHAALGVSVGPFRDIEAEKTCARLFNRLSFIGLRDKESLDITKTIAPDVPAELTFDLAILLPKSEGLYRRIITPPGERKGIGISLCNFERFVGGDIRKENIRKNKILHLLYDIRADINEEIVLIDFNGHSYYGDTKLHDEIATHIGKWHCVRRVTYSSNPLKILMEISELRMMIAMRLHAAVFGYMAFTPTIMLSYHPKCLGWVEMIGHPRAFAFDSIEFDIKKMRACIEDIMNGCCFTPDLPFHEAEQLALKNWVWTNERA